MTVSLPANFERKGERDTKSSCCIGGPSFATIEVNIFSNNHEYNAHGPRAARCA